MKHFFLTACLLLCSAVHATPTETAIQFHPNFKSIPIPHSFEVSGNGVIHAPLGEVTVQSPIVVATVNGHGPFYFMVDTGFATTLFSKRVVKAAQLPWTQTAQLKAATPSQMKKIHQELHLAERVVIGPLTLKNFGVYSAAKSSKEYKIFEKESGRGIDGILGINAFYGLIMTIDYKNESIEVSTKSLRKEEPHVTAISQKAGVPLIELNLVFDKLKKQQSQNFLIDTGAFPYFFINSCDIPQMRQFVGKEKIVSLDFEGVAGDSHLAQLYGRIEITKDYSIQSPYVVYGENNCKHKHYGLLGRKFFELHKVSIDIDDFLVKIVPY